MNSIELNTLTIVGYADRISERTAPAVVPPIFATREDPALVIMPPLTVTETTVTFEMMGTADDLERAVRLGKATRLPQPFDARSNHVLWVDPQVIPRYQPLFEVRETLRTLARAELGRAQMAISLDDLEQASKCAGSAIAADDHFVQAYALKAAILRTQGEEDLVPILAEAAGLERDDEVFVREVARWVGLIQRERRARIVPDRLGPPKERINERSAPVSPSLRRPAAAPC